MAHSPIFRFAPSPNGRLHLGHAASALLNEALVEKMGGKLLVRIEDIDRERCTPELAELCLSDLAWLGLRWEEKVRVQSRHFADYAAALSQLRDRGLLYPCFCSRKQMEAASTGRDPDGAPLYAGTCKHLSLSEQQEKLAQALPHSWRLDMEKAHRDAPLHYTRFEPDGTQAQVQAQPQRWGDVILARKDTPTSYHLSVVVDDALQNITHVVRGQDLEAATCLHRLLQSLLGLPTPLYHHHALVTNEAGDKLSKSKSHESLADLRARGETPASIRRMLGFISG